MQDDASAIRPRRDSDLEACADLVREVHAADRYPRYLPRDIGNFLAPPDPYGCWVAGAGGAGAGAGGGGAGGRGSGPRRAPT